METKKIYLTIIIALMTITSMYATTLFSYSYNQGCLEEKATNLFQNNPQNIIQINRNKQLITTQDSCKSSQHTIKENHLFQKNVAQKEYTTCQLVPRNSEIICKTQELKKYKKDTPTRNTYSFQSKFTQTSNSCCGN